MPIRVLGKGGRIAGGVLVGLFALQTCGWLFYDVGGLGIAGAWDLWLGSTDASRLDAIPATTATDLALLVLQIGAVFAAFTASRAAGGLLAAAVTTTLLYRLPVLWIGGNHTADDPWYAGTGDDTAVVPAILLAVLTVLLAVAAGIALIAGTRQWPPAPAVDTAVPGWPGQPGPPSVPPQAPEPAEAPVRPAGAAAVVSALVLALLALANLAWNGYLVAQGGIGFWGGMFTGSGTVASVLAVPPALRWLVLAALCGMGAVLAGTRSTAARGFTLGAALLLVPESVLTTVWYLDRGLLLELGNSGATGVVSRLQTFVALVGGVAVLVLMGRAGAPVDAQGAPVLQRAAAGALPGQQQGAGGWQQGWGRPAPGGAVQPSGPPAWGPDQGAPQSGPAQPQPARPGPVPPQQTPPGYGWPPPPAQPPGPQPPAPQGGFGPPPQV
ncbi:hypothetical protein [Streptomyces meridianus]|uniref:Integral membrane protein n=1 Tax=Streptomyces meridianus TaxID=2938945 RepID=A0ABT0X529_9ACTN|nr:hypothetical protein [Streptomyces meridianus]MCM2576752.1 hypothetical protein [Streptomyces meridianus]